MGKEAESYRIVQVFPADLGSKLLETALSKCNIVENASHFFIELLLSEESKLD